MQNDNNSNEWINWIEEAISKKHMKYYDHNLFENKKKIGTGGFGKVYRVNWKNSGQCFALKSFNNNDVTVKEIVHEVITKYNMYYWLDNHFTYQVKIEYL